jgi:hypothetical protein
MADGTHCQVEVVVTAEGLRTTIRRSIPDDVEICEEEAAG